MSVTARMLQSVLRSQGRLLKVAHHSNVARNRFFSCTPCIYKSRGVLKDGEKPEDLKNADWEKRLSPAEYFVTREHGTEAPFSGDFVNFFEKGTYTCICCGSELFRSETKFESGCGWPSFSQALKVSEGDLDKESVLRRSDSSHGMQRVEVLCRNCKAHLGHVFPDGPPPTGERFCINSVCLNFNFSEK